MKRIGPVFLSYIFLFFVFFHPSAYADLYSYVDDNGHLHYTNSLENVPPSYRQSVKSEKELPPPDDLEQDGASLENIESLGEQDAGGDVSSNEKIRMFEAERQALAKEFESLKEERKEVVRLGQTAKTQDEFQLYEMRLKDFLERSASFHKRRKEFKKRVREYNAQVRERAKEALKRLEESEAKEAEPAAK